MARRPSTKCLGPLSRNDRLMPQRILVLSPHPDDESFGCGGTIKFLTAAGHQVDVLYMTRGELGVDTPHLSTRTGRDDLKAVRSREARAACDILGVHSVRFLDGRDGHVAKHPEFATELANTLLTEHYERVFCPHGDEAHPDHEATHRWLFEALRRAPLGYDLHVWLYEVWTPLVPNMVVPIDATLEVKMAAIDVHVSQLEHLDYRAAFRGLAAYRSLFCEGCQFAEAFETLIFQSR